MPERPNLHDHDVSALKCPKKLYAGFSGLTGMLLVLIAVTFVSFRQMDEANNWSLPTYTVLVETHTMGEGLSNIDTGAQDFTITGEERFLQPLAQGQAAFLATLGLSQAPDRR